MKIWEKYFSEHLNPLAENDNIWKDRMPGQNMEERGKVPFLEEIQAVIKETIQAQGELEQRQTL